MARDATYSSRRDDTMRLCRVLGFNGSSMHVDSRHGTPGIWAEVLALAFAVLALAGCGSGATTGGTASQGPAATKSGAPVPTSAPSATGQALNDDIPPGRGIADSGGGPLWYTFREEWRRARADAQKWRSGAYLITATGDYVNDDGLPNSWSLKFIDRPDADAVLLVDIDPWGKVTQTRQVTGDGVISFVDQYTKRMPYAIIDSDTAVGLGKAALASQYPLAKTNDPSLSLNFSRLDGSGPYWTYMLFYESTAEYVSAQIDALTGAVTPAT
jgi:hypothetical protein